MAVVDDPSARAVSLKCRRQSSWLPLIALGMLAWPVSTRGQQEPKAFRAATDAVSVAVSVLNGRRPVTGLTAADFELLDNGVPQDITAVTEQVPVDLTLLLDTSPSTAEAIGRFKSGAQQITGMLRPVDRVRLITFATDVTEIFPLRSGGEPMPVEAVTSKGGTSLHDAVVLALARAPVEGRRHLVVVFTDGEDTTSVTSGDALALIAGRSDSVLHLVLSGAYGTTFTVPKTMSSLRRAVEETGGEVYPPGRFNDIVDAFRRVFEDFRQSYVLRYILKGVPGEGWHELTVTLKKPDAKRYTVSARKRYFGG
jgi:VWFA-related protein